MSTRTEQHGYGEPEPPLSTAQYPPPPYPTPGPPPAGMYPGHPMVSKSGPSAWRIVAIVALSVVGLFVVLMIIGFILGGGQDGPTPPAHSPTTTPSVTQTDSGTLPQAFPDITAMGSGCVTLAPQQQPYLTSTNVRPVAIEQCNYSTTAPGTQILYFQWPSAQAAAQWYADSATFPRIEAYDTWTAGNRPQGPSHTQLDTRYNTYEMVAAYNGKPYSFTIYGPTQQAIDTTSGNVRVLDASQLPQ